MTPPSTAHARSTGHARTPTRRGAAPRGPRRVSGPSRTAGGARAARGAVRTAPRVNGGVVALPTPLVQRLGQIPESRTLDRLLRSRGWIAVLAVLLIGLVFMQVSLLKLNAGMGSDVEKAAALSQSNAMLESQLSKLGSNDRIQQLANNAGMVLPNSGDVRYLGADGKRLGGSNPATIPSQGEASTAVLPTVPTDLTGAEGAAGAPATVTPPPASTTPQTVSSVPNTTPAPPAQTPAPATTDPAAAATGATGAATPPSTASAGVASTPPAATTGAAPTGAATVGGATPGA